MISSWTVLRKQLIYNYLDEVISEAAPSGTARGTNQVIGFG